MIRFFFGVVFIATCAFAATPELPLQSTYQQNTDPLTTEKIWVITPEKANPHRVRWILSRHVELTGLQTVETKKGFRPQLDGLFSRSISYIRNADDRSYSTMRDFPCTPTPQDWFATLQGTRWAADRASEKWNELLSREKLKLAMGLFHIEGEFSENAIQDSHRALAHWLDDLEKTWNDSVLPEVRREEWKYYEKQAKEQGACTGVSQKNPRETPSWPSLMEAPKLEDTPKLIGHLPAKRWGGLYSVLVTLKISGKSLVGKFLIDSGAPTSLISPQFLSNQGAYASWIEVPKAHPQKVNWSGGSGVGTPAYVAEADVSGIALPIHDFFIQDTDFFGPPESFSTCCDGVLGVDFLKQYAVEFKPGKVPEVNLYSRAGFHLPKQTPWVEVSSNMRGEIVSDCKVTAEGKSGQTLDGVIWQTGSEEALEYNRPPSAAVRAIPFWRLYCNGERVADHVRITSKEQGMTGTLPIDVGMELLGRGGFTFDLSHGRLWFNPGGFFLPIVQNRSGLNLEYVFNDGDRELHVLGLRKGSSAEALQKGGLRVGMTVLSIGSKSADDMDTWEVEQRLSGVYGLDVAVEWKTGKRASKTASMKLPPIAP